MLNPKLGLSALLMEMTAWTGPAMMSSQSDGALLSYLVGHGFASVLLALFVLPVLPRSQARPKGAVLALIAFVSYAVPIGGFLGVLGGLLILRFYKSKPSSGQFDSVQLPEFDLHQRLQGGFRQAGLRSFLGNAEVPVRTRLRAMVALQYVSGRVATPLLRNVLNDPSEDLRMLAYGMIDTQEQRINRAIDHELHVLRQAAGGQQDLANNPVALEAAQHLAELYWELVYQELAQGDLREHAMREALRYGDMVLAAEPTHTLLWLQRGRLLHSLGQGVEAGQCYQKALSMGAAATRVLPYQAELCFEQRDFATTRMLMQRLNTESALPRLRPMIDYWSAT
jgi:tetratricopeptide (TPR) repeat protein